MTKTRPSFEEFYREVPDTALRHNWRLGQAFFNLLEEKHPALAMKIRGSSKDPFYCYSSNESRYQEAINFVKSNW